MSFALLVFLTLCVAGLLSLSVHVVYAATGRQALLVGAVALCAAYASGVLLNSGSGMALAVGAGIGAGVLAGGVAGLVSSALTVEEFLLVALAAAEVAKRLAYHAQGITGGAVGLPIAGMGRMGLGYLAALVGAVTILLALVTQRWFRSPRGVRWRVVGGAPRAAALIGIPATAVRFRAFCLSGAIAGGAGVVQALIFRYVNPEDFGLTTCLAALAVGMAVSTSRLFRGLVVWTVVVFGLREVLRVVDLGGAARFAVFNVVVGIAVVIVAAKLAHSEGNRE